MGRIVKITADQDTMVQAAPENTTRNNVIERRYKENANKIIKYIDDYRSASDTKSLREEGYEIDYDKLVGVGHSSAVFLAHLISAPPPPVDKTTGSRPLYTPGYDFAVKVTARKWIDQKKPQKTRTSNLKLALALGKTKPENNILKVIDVFKTPDRIFVFMQYCAFGNVVSFIRRNNRVPSKLAQRWSSQMAQALIFLHKFHIAHRNYKLENVLVDENLNAKLTGFGLSKFCMDLNSKKLVMSHTICGSEPYLAPEMLKDPPERSYDPKQADVWAYGVGVFLCLTRCYPFEGSDLKSLRQQQEAGKYLRRDTKGRIKPYVKVLLRMLFVLDPNSRPTMADLYNQSVWLQSNGSQSGRSKGQALQFEPRDPDEPSEGKKPVSPQMSQAPEALQPQPVRHSGSGKHQKDRDSGQHQPEKAWAPVTPQVFQPEDALPPNTNDYDL